MIDPPQVLSEEPTAVTPHGGICGGESQQWLSYPTKPHAGIVRGAVSNHRPYRDRRETGKEQVAPVPAVKE